MAESGSILCCQCLIIYKEIVQDFNLFKCQGYILSNLQNNTAVLISMAGAVLPKSGNKGGDIPLHCAPFPSQMECNGYKEGAHHTPCQPEVCESMRKQYWEMVKCNVALNAWPKLKTMFFFTLLSLFILWMIVYALFAYYYDL